MKMNYHDKMTDCSKMSDFEINKRVAELIGGFCFYNDGTPYKLEENSCPAYSGVDFDEFEFAPCNNPADAWPIIINNKISIINAGDEWLCIPEGETVDGWTGDSVDCIWHSRGCVDKNPLRAAMIVFLMMQEKTNGD